MELIEKKENQVYETTVNTVDGSPRNVIFYKSVFLAYDGTVAGIVGVVADITERVMAEADRVRLVAELTESLAKVKQLSGMLPICAYCKKIRDDKGYWERVETYISKHTDTVFSHGACPECAEKVMKELEEFKKKSVH
jgi:hypothetical protein